MHVGFRWKAWVCGRLIAGFAGSGPRDTDKAQIENKKILLKA
jgi:hypothetical protein